VEFAYLTGWRLKSEVLALQWWQVDFEAGMVRLEPGSTKNADGRVFPFAALPALERLLRTQAERTRAIERASGSIIPWVFHRAGTPIRYFRRAWIQACRLAGLPDRLPHDFRRTAVRNLERAGVPRSVAMKLTGHKTESIYRRYAIVAEQDLKDGVAKLAALHQRSEESRRTIAASSAQWASQQHVQVTPRKDARNE
jgi:integrase